MGRGLDVVQMVELLDLNLKMTVMAILRTLKNKADIVGRWTR